MKNAILVLGLTAVLVAGAVAVYAGPPLSGTWKSTNGDFDEGTATTKWAAGSFVGLGNTLYGRSFAGGVFTNDWTIQCPTVVAVTVLTRSTADPISLVGLPGALVVTDGTPRIELS